MTVQSREDVPFERTKAQKSTRDEKQQLTLASAMQSNDKNAVTAKYVSLLFKLVASHASRTLQLTVANAYVCLLSLILAQVYVCFPYLQLEGHAVQATNGEAIGSSKRRRPCT